MMKRMKKSLSLMLLAMVLLLSACGKKPVFGVSTNEDNSISITADRGPKDSMGLGYLTVGENEQVVIDAAGMGKDGKLSIRFMAGVPGSDEFSGEPVYETSVSGGDSAVFTAEPGEYTVEVIAQSKLTGTAQICLKAADGTAAAADPSEAAPAAPDPSETAPSEAAPATAAESDLALQPGEHFEGTVALEGTEQTVHYEAIRNDALGFEMGYDYENFVRRSEADCERFISAWDNPDDPEIYLEITHSPVDAETTATSITETLSAQYDVSRWDYTLDRAGDCIDLRGEVDKEGEMSIWELQMVYIIPADDGCFVAWGHYTQESAEGSGARFRGMMHTFAPL